MASAVKSTSSSHASARSLGSICRPPQPVTPA